MKYLLWSIGFYACLLFSPVSIGQNTAIYVSPSGNDAGAGTQSSPVLTLSHALDLARSSASKKIVLRGGKYYGVGITLDQRDQGLQITNYQGETPILYGGKLVSGFQQEGQFVYAPVPGSNNRSWDFRMLLVGDSVRPRSRYPAQGGFTLLNQFNAKILGANEGYYSSKPTDAQMRQLQYNATDVDNGLDPNNAELSIFHQWDESYVGLQNVDTVNHVLTFTYPASRPLGSYSASNPTARQYVIWNTKEGMTQPGQWYLDRTRQRLYYWPLDGETPSSIQVVAPFYNHIIAFNKGADNITISGLTFTASSNQLQNEKMTGYNIDAAIEGTGNNVTLINLSIRNTTGTGIKLTGNNDLLSKLQLYQTGGPGLVTNGNNDHIDQVRITYVGVVFTGASGMNVTGTSDTISNCLINHAPYSGITMGGKNSIIENNTLLDFMNFLSDGAGIYLGRVSGMQVLNNTLVGSNLTLKNCQGLYFDELGNNNDAENNLVINSGNVVLFNVSNHIHVSNNIFLDAGKQYINANRASALSVDSNLFFSGEFHLFIQDSSLASFSSNGVYLNNQAAAVKPFALKYFQTNTKGYVPVPHNVSLHYWLSQNGLNKVIDMSRFTQAQLNVFPQNL